MGLLLVALCVLASTARAPCARAAEAAGIDRLREAARRHPDDFDLAWALDRQLVRDDRLEEAIASLRLTVRRWPERPEVSLLLGSLLSEVGRPEEALPHLERAVALDPSSGAARLQLGLALRNAGRPREAIGHFQAAGRLEPALRNEALLLRGITHIEEGDEATGVPLLREAIARDPDSETARDARLLLGPEVSQPNRYRLDAYAGLDYDSNVILDSGALPGVSTDQEDGVGVWGTAFRFDPRLGERYGLSLGARVDGSDHFDLEDYDERSFTGFLTARFYESPTLRWRLDGAVSHARLGGDPYLLQGVLRPNLTAILGERAGVARLFAEVEMLEYEDEPLFPSLERDGVAFGATLEHHVPLPGWRNAWGAWRFAYRRLETDARRDAAGFAGAYDHDRYEGGLEASLPLPWKLEAVARASLAGEAYHHANVIDALFDPSNRRRKRDDLVFEGRLELARPLTAAVDVALQWEFIDRNSNVDLYAYDRHVAGLRLRFHSY